MATCATAFSLLSIHISTFEKCKKIVILLTDHPSAIEVGVWGFFVIVAAAVVIYLLL